MHHTILPFAIIGFLFLATEYLDCASTGKINPSLPVKREERSFGGEIIPLGNVYPNGISIRVLFTFDNNFYKNFDGEDGKSADEHMEEVLKHLKYAYQDNTFQREIGTTVNIIANKTTYDGSFRGKSRKDMTEHYRSSPEKEIYDLIVYVTHPKEGKYGSTGYSNFGQVCNEDGKRFTTVYAYGPEDCNLFDPPKPIDCSTTNRLTLTAELIAHMMGKSLGMKLDIEQICGTEECTIKNREYKGEKCKGLMDYTDNGIGWSKCSMLDFSTFLSQYVTSEGIPTCLGDTPAI